MLGYLGLFQAYISVSATSTLQHHCKLLKMAQQREKPFKWQKSLNSLLNTDIVPNLRQISMTKIFPRHFHDIWPIPCYLARFSRQASLCEEVTRYKQSHNLVGSLNDVMQPHVPVILLYRKLLQIAVATKHLQRLHANTGLHWSS